MKQKDNSNKLRGSYSTPYPIAKFLAEWAIKTPTDHILEPGCGEGLLLETAVRRLQSIGSTNSQIRNQVVGIEINERDCKRAINRLESLSFSELKNHLASSSSTELAQSKFQIICGDFFRFFSKNPERKFDAVIGNPPFIRYQSWDEDQRDLAFRIMKAVDIKVNHLTNAWMPFLVVSSLSLKPNGRLAMVIPAELLQVKYAAQLRLFLSAFYNSISIISFKKLVFPLIQQEVVLLLAEKRTKNGHGINLLELNDASDLENINMEKVKTDFKPIEHTEDKWTQYFLTSEEILLLREMKKYKGVKKFGDIASVDVGIVTGENEFFLIDKSTLHEFHLEDYVLPLLGRTPHIKGIAFRTAEWEQTRLRNAKSYLLSLPEKGSSQFKEGLLRYLSKGEKNEVNKGYKCSIRKFWYSVPSVWISDAFLTRQINAYPRLVLNEAQVAVTDTIHRVKFKEGIEANDAIVCFHNSLTFAFSEIMGRSYGGGVLELEPNEAEQLPVPYFKTKITLQKTDELVRNGKIQEVLDIVDSFALMNCLGLSKKQVSMLRGIWEKLSKRRLERKHTISKPFLQATYADIQTSELI